MSGIRETRKKLQRSVLYLSQCKKAEVALHELMLLKQTVDSQVELLSKKLNLLEECEDAPNSKEVHEANRVVDEDAGDPVEQAAHQGYDTLYNNR